MADASKPAPTPDKAKSIRERIAAFHKKATPAAASADAIAKIAAASGPKKHGKGK